MIKKISIENSVGMVLAHDMTKIVGEFKGVAFRKGHIINKEDLPELLNIGKGHIYVLELEEGEVHEEEAARRIATAVAGAGLELGSPKEGRVNIETKTSGLLKVNVSLLEEVNSIEEVILATLHDNTLCHSGMIVAGTRIIPLLTTEAVVGKVEHACRRGGKVIEVIPFKERRVGVVITGREVFEGRIKDRFGEVIQRKVEALGSVINHKTIVPDDADLIAQALAESRSRGSELIVACGGMSVDPDDVTRIGIGKVGAEIISYGAPVLPGSMFLYAKWGEVPILGAPACVIHDPTTIFDLILPRVLAGEEISREDIVRLGHGGLCLHCDGCSFPLCPFGK